MRTYKSPSASSSKNPGIYKSSTSIKRVAPQQAVISSTSLPSEHNLLRNTKSQQYLHTNEYRPPSSRHVQFRDNKIETVRSGIQYSPSKQNNDFGSSNMEPYKSQLFHEQSSSMRQNHQRQHSHLAENREIVGQRSEKPLHTFANSDEYKGQWGKDHANAEFPHGYGCYVFKNQNIEYRGSFDHGKMHGKGTLHRLLFRAKPELIYEGEWYDGYKHGTGRYYYDKDTYYEGDWNRNRKEGNGHFSSPRGSYVGQWLQDKRHGKGRLTLSNGTVYDGMFKMDEFVEGEVHHTNSDVFRGTMKDWDRDGNGQYSNIDNEQVYRGSWRDNKKDGPGDVSFRNGEHYNGGMSLDVREGTNCTYQWSSGERIHAQFHNNYPVRGQMILPDRNSFDFDMNQNQRQNY